MVAGRLKPIDENAFARGKKIILNQFFFSSRFLSADPIAADRGEAHRAIGSMFSRAHLEGGRARHSDDENNQKRLRATRRKEGGRRARICVA